MDWLREQDAVKLFSSINYRYNIYMATNPLSLTQRPGWRALAAHHQEIKDIHLRQFFAADPKRGERLVIEDAGIYLDYSKNRINEETIRLLIALAEECGLRARIEAMFRGEKINVTEKRAVLHVALRAPHDQSILVDGENVVPKVHEVLDGWLISPIVFAAAPGRGILASASAM